MRLDLHNGALILGLLAVLSLHGEVAASRVKTRKALASDADVIWSVRSNAILRLCKRSYGPKLATRWSKVKMPPGFAEHVQKHSIVATIDDQVVGWGMVSPEKGLLDALFVSPEFAGQGIGTKLMHRLESQARRGGVTTLRLSASLNAVEFYESFGFQKTRPYSFQHPAGFELRGMRMLKHFE